MALHTRMPHTLNCNAVVVVLWCAIIDTFSGTYASDYFGLRLDSPENCDVQLH